MAVKSGLTVVRDDLAKVAAGIALLATSRVLVGVPAAETNRKAEDGKPPKITNAGIAYVQDLGSPELNIPARPFLRPGVEAVQGQIEHRMKQAGDAALNGKPDVVDRALHAVGLIAQASVRKKIVDGPFIPLAPATLAARRRKGFAGTKPLTVTGQLRNAISYVIRRGGRDISR
jgi:hypothetical protein